MIHVIPRKVVRNIYIFLSDWQYLLVCFDRKTKSIPLSVADEESCSYDFYLFIYIY